MPALEANAYRVRVIQLLVHEIPHRALAQIIDSAQGLRGHLAEFEVQRMMTNLLSLHLPSPELVDWNVALKHPALDSQFIPDIQIKDVHRELWAAYEVKTLFRGGELDLSTALADLDKLVAYKSHYPYLACFFWLVADSHMLSDARRASHWAETPLAYDANSFAQRTAPRIIDEAAETKYVARPAMSSADGQVSCYAWEILPLDQLRSDTNYDFHFEAVMSGAVLQTRQPSPACASVQS